ncbi:MAG: Lrp/AsnC family transcriptional regulator [Verrucomicrobia bacterium]|nr:MAG: Lrp/AsnC family transcriptional regulator [Verrucomicrobiota bacterium]
MDAAKKQLLGLLQRGLPLVARPFAELGRTVGWTEEQVLQFVRDLFSSDAARPLSAVFDARRLGYRSVLCAINEPNPERLAQLAGRVAAHSGVTHVYERSWPTELDPHSSGGPGAAMLPNLWFVLAASQTKFEAAAQELRDFVAPYAVLFFPARKRFKIDVVFEPEQLANGENFPDDDSPCEELSVIQQELVCLLQGALPVVPDLFAQLAQRVRLSEQTVLAQLCRWQAAGVLRRIALAVRHRSGGFKATAMCVWSVAAERIIAAGRALAAFPEVEHCYERATLPAFRYNLFAMIHTSSWLQTQRLFERLAGAVGVTDGRMLCSVREFKKSGLTYFAGKSVVQGKR